MRFRKIPKREIPAPYCCCGGWNVGNQCYCCFNQQNTGNESHSSAKNSNLPGRSSPPNGAELSRQAPVSPTAMLCCDVGWCRQACFWVQLYMGEECMWFHAGMGRTWEIVSERWRRMESWCTIVCGWGSLHSQTIVQLWCTIMRWGSALNALNGAWHYGVCIGSMKKKMDKNHW